MRAGGSRCLRLLKKCKNIQQIKQAHTQILTSGLGDDSFALSRLLDFYSHPINGNLPQAWNLFRQIESPTICIFNTMIKAFFLSGEFISAVNLFSKFLRSGLLPDNYTLPYVVMACKKIRNFFLGELIHGCGLKFGFLIDIFVANSLISMYCGFGKMKDARHLFDEIPHLSAVTWTVMISGYSKAGDVEMARLFFDETPEKDRGIWGAMISGYVYNNCFKEGLCLFRLMQSTNIVPDEAILVSILCACAHLGALDIGVWIHRFIELHRFPLSVRLRTGLIDMYAKCGNLRLAREVFDRSYQRDVICWNAMISGAAMNGDGENALKLFSEMVKSHVEPDDITFIAVFSACSYSNMASEGLRLFDRMCRFHRIKPKSEHLGCLVDMLSKAGLHEEAEKIIQRVPKTTNPSEEVAWRAFLSACCSRGEAQKAEMAADRLFNSEPDSGVYVLLSNLYASLGKHGDARRVRKIMNERGVDKPPGCSSIEINGVIYEFISGEKTHPQMEDIHLVLDKIKKQIELFSI